MTEETPKKMVENNCKSDKLSEAREGFVRGGGMMNVAPQTPRPPAPKADPPPTQNVQNSSTDKK